MAKVAKAWRSRRLDPRQIPTLDELAAFTARLWVSPMHERIDALLVTSAQHVGAHGWPGELAPAAGDVRLAPFVRGDRRVPPTYYQVARSVIARSAQRGTQARQRPAVDSGDTVIAACAWCAMGLMLFAGPIVSWPAIVRCANCRRMCLWDQAAAPLRQA